MSYDAKDEAKRVASWLGLSERLEAQLVDHLDAAYRAGAEEARAEAAKIAYRYARDVETGIKAAAEIRALAPPPTPRDAP